MSYECVPFRIYDQLIIKYSFPREVKSPSRLHSQLSILNSLEAKSSSHRTLSIINCQLSITLPDPATFFFTSLGFP